MKHKKECTRKNRSLCECDPSSNSPAWKTETQHTPTPWAHHPTKWGDQIDHKIVGKDGRVLAIMNDSYLGVDSEQVGINAEFIVRAVNSHEALLRSAKLALEVLQREFNDGYIQQGLREVIAQVEGK